MNILVTLDKNYLKHLVVMLYSLLKSNSNVKIDVYVMNSSLTNEDFSYIETNINSDMIDVIDIKIDNKMLSDAPITDRYPKEMYYRIFAAKYLPKNIDKIIYLDPDLVIINSLEKLYNMNLGDYFFAAASHVWGPISLFNKIRLQMEEDIYINSGVMLMNLKSLRKHQNVKEVYKFIEKNKNYLMLPDQDVISGLYSSKILPLDPYIYNMTERLLTFKRVNKLHVNLKWIKDNTVVIHYCGRNKPWNKNYIGKLDRFYLKYQNEVFKKHKVK